MASLKQNGRRRGFSEGRFQATDWLSRGALFKRAFPSLPLAGATDTSFFFLCVWFSAVAVRLCAPAFAIFFHAIEMPGDSRLKPSTQRAFGSRKKRAWNKKAPATSAPSAAELESRPDPLDLPGTSTDDTVGPSSTSETLRVDAAYYSTAEQAQRVERSAQTKTVLSGKSATQRKFDLLGVSAECQTGDAGTDFLLVDMKVLNNFFAQAKCDKCVAKSLSVRKATDKEYGLAPQDEGYTDWLATHECQRNIECNSGRMEVEAALTMFQRSWAKHGLRYTTVLSDGDSRTFHALSEAEVYGFIQIDKKDCINHVHKRMGAALRNLVDKKKAQVGDVQCSPVYVDEAVDLQVACRRLMWGKYVNAGQTCIAPDYVLCHTAVYAHFVDTCKKVITEFYSQQPKESADLGRIVNTNHCR
ncbi:hypothetical protein HPB52_015760 [Rhipicephalus sanguineus]|uniref:Aldehyde dehydrogenase n=1 Tax=Rhipicephalus sanguineus TaxID=34632 RepID=A0A9D4Q0Y6_RHISA|nr:hypothetical protein HPB52_015760 [Rhipicephalus sanguineus]